MAITRYVLCSIAGYCGKAEQHDYQLYLAINDIEPSHSRRGSIEAVSKLSLTRSSRFRTMLRDDYSGQWS